MATCGKGSILSGDGHARRLLTFLTDFGLAWGPVGTCHAVAASIAPEVRVVDLSHGIPPFDLRAGAWVLASALPFTPVAVHVAVVDPGVGTSRLPLAVHVARGDLLIGPDNGLLIPAAERLGGIREVREITNSALMRQPVSPTFHGRDIFVPVGAHLAASQPFEEVGRVVESGQLRSPPWKRPDYAEHRVEGEVALLDNFGNVRTNIEVQRWPIERNRILRLNTPSNSVDLPTASTFGEVATRDLIVFDDSSGYVCIAMNQGSAGEALGLQSGMALGLERI